MEKNKTGKYLKYAFGEIVLVMIGILLALQVNNWNVNRIAHTKEKLLLKELNNEFKLNKIQFDSVLFIHRRTFNAAEKLLSKLPIDIKNIDLDSLGYYTFYLGWTYTFNPSQGITNSLVNGASFQLISNDSLRNLLIRWSDIVADYQEEELKAFNNYINHLKPYEKKHILFSNDYKEIYNDSRIDLSFLESIEYENYIRDRYNDLSDIVVNPEYELVIKTIDQIIELSNTEIDD